MAWAASPGAGYQAFYWQLPEDKPELKTPCCVCEATGRATEAGEREKGPGAALVNKAKMPQLRDSPQLTICAPRPSLAIRDPGTTPPADFCKDPLLRYKRMKLRGQCSQSPRFMGCSSRCGSLQFIKWLPLHQSDSRVSEPQPRNWKRLLPAIPTRTLRGTYPYLAVSLPTLGQTRQIQILLPASPKCGSDPGCSEPS